MKLYQDAVLGCMSRLFVVSVLNVRLVMHFLSSLMVVLGIAEYAYTMKITDKSDVYSFGVVLLEIVTGKKPVDPSFTDAVDLVGWVNQQVKAGRGDRSICDRRLEGLPEALLCEMEEVLGIALLCVSPSPNDRPNMREVVAMLVAIQQDTLSWMKSKSLSEPCSKQPILCISPDSDDSSWSRT